MEYILVATAVVVVLITAVLIKSGPFVNAVNSVMEAPATRTSLGAAGEASSIAGGAAFSTVSSASKLPVAQTKKIISRHQQPQARSTSRAANT
jgi:hypothetical protein